MALATLNEVKDALGITTTDQDTQISALLEPLSSLIEREAGREFMQKQVTERHYGGEPTIALRRWPVAGGSPILTVKDKVTGETLDADQYELEENFGLLRRLPLGSQWATAGINQIFWLEESVKTARWEITYTGGPETVPEDIKLALFYAVSSAIAGGGMRDFQSEKDGDYSYTRAQPSVVPSALPLQSRAILLPYKRGLFI